MTSQQGKRSAGGAENLQCPNTGVAFMKPLSWSKSERLAAQAAYKFHRILVAVDFSEESRNALACAAELAARCEASLMLVHVVEPHLNPVPPAHPQDPVGGPEPEEFADAKVELNALGLQMLGPCRLVETSVRGGLAFFEVTEAARALAADLIVVGAGASRAALGGTAEKIMHHAPCPVLVV